LAGVIGEAGEDGLHIAAAQMLGNNFAEDAAVVGGDGEVASLVELPVIHARPLGIDFPAFDVAAHYKHAVGVTVIGSAIPVLMGRSSEFRHADEYDVAHAIAHVLIERGNSLP